MTKKIILLIIIIASIIIIGCLQLSSKPQPINQEISYDYINGDLSYSVMDLGEEEYFKVSVSDCVYFEANYYHGACAKYNYKYILEKGDLKITLTDRDECEKHMEPYGIKGKICDLKIGQYNIILGVELYDGSIDEVFKKTIEVK